MLESVIRYSYRIQYNDTVLRKYEYINYSYILENRMAVLPSRPADENVVD